MTIRRTLRMLARFKRTFGDHLRAKRESLRSGKPLWLASCSIGCRNWGVLRPMRPAPGRVQGITSFSRSFVQQIRGYTLLQEAVSRKLPKRIF